MRRAIRRWLEIAVGAVDPEALTMTAVGRRPPAADTLIGIGKAAPGMCRGAARALGKPVNGICVSAEPGAVPGGVHLLVGDHPVPAESSYEAGRAVLDAARTATEGCLVLVSGGGSALCEWPRPGVDKDFLSEVNRRLLVGGVSIEQANLVRGHLSALKCGGLARSGEGPFHTYVLSDVAGAGPEVVASGPTLPMSFDPNEARRIMLDSGLDVSEKVWEAMRMNAEAPTAHVPVTIIGDGRTAAAALREAALSDGVRAEVMPGWLTGDVSDAVDRLLASAGSGLTIAAGETSVVVEGNGRGGRNTHAALLAAQEIEGTPSIFAAFATDGVDGNSGAAGAIVDGDTIGRGGDPSGSLRDHDSAGYLGSTGDLLHAGPTGTNVADLWLLLRP